MLSEKGQQEMAQSIYNAFASYKASYDGENVDLSKIKKRPDPSTVTDDTAADEADESEESDNTPAAQTGETVYKVQFMALPHKLSKNSKEFKGLSPVEVYYEKGYYKYTYGASTSRKGIEADFQKVRKLFKDAFIIAMRDGKRVQ